MWGDWSKARWSNLCWILQVVNNEARILIQEVWESRSHSDIPFTARLSVWLDEGEAEIIKKVYRSSNQEKQPPPHPTTSSGTYFQFRLP